MERFIENPHLPHGKVKSVLLGSDYTKLAEVLENKGIRTVLLPPNECIAAQVRSHADMSAYYCGRGKLILSRNIYHKCRTEMFPDGMILQCSSEYQNDKFPFDIGLNACPIDDILFCRTENTDATILYHAALRGLKIVNIKQGYAKCSICVLDEKHIITADKGIYQQATAAGIETLLIDAGFFALSGYDYGFIGGSCFKTGKDTVAFTGTLDEHPNKYEIIDFVNDIGLNVEYLTTERCFDVGSIIPLTEER